MLTERLMEYNNILFLLLQYIRLANLVLIIVEFYFLIGKKRKNNLMMPYISKIIISSS